MGAPGVLGKKVEAAVKLAQKAGLAAAASKYGVHANTIRYHVAKATKGKKVKVKAKARKS